MELFSYYYPYSNKLPLDSFNNSVSRVLLTDILFPNKYAKWRLTEILAFINKYDTDILIIHKVIVYAGITFNFDYNELYNKFKLNEYDILIFNPEFNYINKYNESNFDGTKYNNIIKSDYLFRKKKYRNEDFNINKYDMIYHIFLCNYNYFNDIFKFPFNKQCIHLYPGGGLTDLNSTQITTVDKNTKIISTQYFITEYLNKYNYSCINLFGGPFFDKNEIIKRKNIQNNLTICFTSMGDIYEKGADKYVELVNIYYNTQTNENINKIKFISIGNCPDNQKITKIEKMDQNKLSEYYYNNVDILINLDSGKALNGFPLGLEGVIEGCVLLTTDINNSNIKNNFNFNEFIIINRDDLNNIINKINKLLDIDFRKKLSYELQDTVYKLFNYDNYMKKVFEYIEK